MRSLVSRNFDVKFYLEKEVGPLHKDKIARKITTVYLKILKDCDDDVHLKISRESSLKNNPIIF